MQARSHLYLSCNLWDSLWIIQQPTCLAISREEPVLYVERFVSVFTILRYPRLWRRLFTWLRGARSVAPNLRVLAPLPLFHLGHAVPFLFRWEFAIQRRWILSWANRGQGGGRVLWVDSALYECAVGRLGESLSVYHVADEASAFPTSHARIVASLERQLLQKVTICFAAAKQLAEHKRTWAPRTFTIWNGIDPRAFADRTAVAPDRDVSQIPTPRVAFVGMLDEWVDLQLIELAAARLPHVHFVIVGPSNVDDAPLRGHANVHLLGQRDRVAVPHILSQCSASLVPFRKTKLTERIVPLKVFEALAAGIIPICTDFSVDLEDLARDGYAQIGRSAEAFVAAVAEATTADTPQRREWLSSYGRRQTWDARWAQMRDMLDAVISEHGPA